MAAGSRAASGRDCATRAPSSATVTTIFADSRRPYPVAYSASGEPSVDDRARDTAHQQHDHTRQRELGEPRKHPGPLPAPLDGEHQRRQRAAPHRRGKPVHRDGESADDARGQVTDQGPADQPDRGRARRRNARRRRSRAAPRRRRTPRPRPGTSARIGPPTYSRRTQSPCARRARRSPNPGLPRRGDDHPHQSRSPSTPPHSATSGPAALARQLDAVPRRRRASAPAPARASPPRRCPRMLESTLAPNEFCG